MYIIRKHFKDGLENFAFVFCLGTYFAFVDQSFFPFQRRREAERVKVLVFFFCESQQQKQWVPILQKSSKLIMHGEWVRGFISFLAKIPLIGMLSALHQFIESIVKRGKSLNFRVFFSNHHPKSRRRAERVCTCLSLWAAAAVSGSYEPVVLLACLYRTVLIPGQ